MYLHDCFPRFLVALYQYLSQAVISSIASLKRRTLPTAISHPSVGTEGDLVARVEARKSLDALRLTQMHLEQFVLTITSMKHWGYITEIPEGPGGERSNEVGSIVKCERCGQPFTVSRQANPEECLYHWGKPYTRVLNGTYAFLVLPGWA
jgi:RNA exonuclease 1